MVPSMLSAGEAMNVVPAEGELTIDVRARSEASFPRVLEHIARSSETAELEVELLRSWPGMNTRASSTELLEAASARLGRPVTGVGRGGASDASHFAATIPITIDGLGPRGGHAHSPHEYVYGPSLGERAEVAIAIVETLLARETAP